jgi:hypothetical protein
MKRIDQIDSDCFAPDAKACEMIHELLDSPSSTTFEVFGTLFIPKFDGDGEEGKYGFIDFEAVGFKLQSRKELVLSSQQKEFITKKVRDFEKNVNEYFNKIHILRKEFFNEIEDGRKEK